MLKLTMEDIVFLVRTEPYNLPMWLYKLYDNGKLKYDDNSITINGIRKPIKSDEYIDERDYM